jgi:hypothetical protein
VREAYEFRVGKDIFHVRMDDGVSEPEYGPAFEPDPVVRTAPDTFLSLISGRLEPADAIGLGRLDVQGTPEIPRRGGEIFGHRWVCGWSGTGFGASLGARLQPVAPPDGVDHDEGVPDHGAQEPEYVEQTSDAAMRLKWINKKIPQGKDKARLIYKPGLYLLRETLPIRWVIPFMRIM